MIEKTQQSFTRYITGMQGLSYPERLTVLGLYSHFTVEERYIIIYVWKIVECQVHSIFPPIRSRTSDHRGRACIASHVGVGILGTIAYNSFRWRAICMFNQMPLFLRNTTVCSVYSFKKKFDLYLSTVPDIPCQPGFNNSLNHRDCLRWQTPVLILIQYSAGPFYGIMRKGCTLIAKKN